MTVDFKTLLAGARLPERTVALCLRGDLVAEVDQLVSELKVAEGKPTGSLAGNGSGELIRRIEELQDEMRAHTYPVRMRALPRSKRSGDDRPSWRELTEAHPPRKDADGDVLPEDRLSGVDRSTFFEPLVRLSIIDPELTDDQWRELNESLTDRQFGELSSAAWDLNQGRVDIPFSPADLRKIRDSFSA